MNEDLIKYIGKTFGNLTVFGIDLDHKGYVYCQSTGKEKTITRVSIRKLLKKTNYPRTQKQKESAIRASRSRDMKIVAIKQALTALQNSPNKRNKTGVKGVCFNKAEGKFRAYINVNGKRYYLGDFHKFEDAVVARKEAEGKAQTELERLLQQRKKA